MVPTKNSEIFKSGSNFSVLIFIVGLLLGSKFGSNGQFEFGSKIIVRIFELKLYIGNYKKFKFLNEKFELFEKN